MFPAPANYNTTAAPNGWTIKIGSEFVPLLGTLIQVDEYNFGAIRGVTSSGIAPEGAEMRGPGGEARNITGVAAAGGSNVSEVTITVTDENGDAVAKVHHLDVWLSDAATGAGLTGTSASGTVTNKSASGRIIATHTAKKELRVETLETGVFVLEITDTAKTAFKVCATLNGKAVVLATLATASYGA